MTEDADDTVRLPRVQPRRNLSALSRPYWAGIAVLAVVLAAGGVWLTRPSTAPPIPAAQTRVADAPAPAEPAASAPSPQAAALGAPVIQPIAFAPPPPPRYTPPLASEADILADVPDALRVYRFAPRPSIIVLHYPDLAEQSRALNRMAALIEKVGYPRDRVLALDELDRRIRADGGDPATFYYGHDYRAADVARFFALAERAGMPLTPQEAQVQAVSEALGWHMDGAVGAMISVTRLDPATGIDAGARATVLRHELSHGEYFTTPEYAAYVLRFWTETLTDKERKAFTAFLTADGYDPTQQDLIVNETQAYLMHTRDTRFFSASAVGITPARLDVLRALFLTGMPAGWLRDCTTAPTAALPARAPRRRRRPVQGFGRVRTIRTVADRRAPCRCAAATAASSWGM